MSVDIAPISAGHIDGYREAVGSVAAERRYLALTEAPPLDGCRAFVLGNIGSGNPHFVALERSRVIGWCDIVRKPHGMLRHSGTLGMGVIASHRGRGIGGRLLAETLGAAKVAKMVRVELTVYASNTAAKALYEQAGFALEGVMRNYTIIDGRPTDALLMAIADLTARAA